MNEFDLRYPTKSGNNPSQVDKDQKRWALVLCLIVAGTVLSNLGIGFQNVFGVSQQSISFIAKAIVGLGLLACAPTFLRNKNAIYVVALILVAFFVSLSQCILFPSTNPYFIDTMLTFFTLVLPICASLLMLESYDIALLWLFRTSCGIALVVGVSTLIFGGRFFEGYSMSLSTSLIIPANVIILYSIKKRQKLLHGIVQWALVATIGIAILLYGSRGALAAIILFTFVLFVRSSNKSKSSIILALFVVAFISAVVYNFDGIVAVVAELANAAGFHSRTLYLLSLGEVVTHDSGRSDLYEPIISDIISNPIIIRGIDSDSAVLGTYCHNFALALIHSFGVLFGVPAVLFIAYASLRTLAKPDSVKTYVMLLFFFSFFPILLWSGSIWVNQGFWAWIVLYVLDRHNEKRKQRALTHREAGK